MVYSGIGLFILAQVLIPRDDSADVTTTGFIAGLIMILSLILFFSGIAGAIYDAVKGRKKSDE